MRIGGRRRTPVAVAMVVALSLTQVADGAQTPAFRSIDQGPRWDEDVRAEFYRLDQGSRMIPLTWLRALRQPGGAPFLGDALARYGYLPDRVPSDLADLPVGFSVAPSSQGPSVGLTCAACHTRAIDVGGGTWRIDGGPAFADFESFLVDLDAAVLRVLATDASFDPFARSVLGAGAEPKAVEHLRAAVGLWSTRFHTLMSRPLPRDRPWGVARLDDFSMIYDRLAALDLGAPPAYLIPENVARADAPVRYPFIWNSSVQDRTQWPGFANNGDDRLALARNLGEVYGVFAILHPQPSPAGAFLDRDYLSQNTGNLAGLAALEALVRRLGPPVWPWPVDRTLAAAGKVVFDRPPAAGGCVSCHGIEPGETRGGQATWKTPVVDVGTDTREWKILVRSAKAGSLEGASIPGVVAPLRETTAAANILKTAVLGALAQANAKTAAHMDEMSGIIRTPATTLVKLVSPNAAPARATPVPGAYEARVLRGIWAAAPYLHNGSVPTLTDLLKPAAERPKTFKIGRAYDVDTVGLAADQPGLSFLLTTTGCADRASGNSNCGHEFGTRLSGADKRALLEYLKTL